MGEQAKVAVVGATGYGGAELLRNLLRHPHVEVTRAVAIDHVGDRVGDVHPPLSPLTDLVVEEMPAREAARDVDAVFFALPHRTSAEVIQGVFDAGVKIVDLSGDFRLRDMKEYEAFYGPGHPCPEATSTFAYGLPELHREAIVDAQRIASPGCFATTIALGLLPVARAGHLEGTTRVVAMTGSSGSGALPRVTTHHPLRATNLRTYRPLTHQHTPEIVQVLHSAGATSGFSLQFVPISAPLVRGILACAFVDVPADFSDDEASRIFHDAYDSEPFIRIVEGRQPEVNAVAGSMYVEVGWHLGDDLGNGRRELLCFSALDNLVKGGAGQAVQSFNLMMGWPETTGIDEPALWP